MFARRYSPQLIKQYSVLFVTLLVSVFAAGNVSAQPDRLSRTFADIAKKVGPAVVSIDTKGKVNPAAAKETAEPDDPENIMDFFRRQLPQRPVYAPAVVNFLGGAAVAGAAGAGGGMNGSPPAVGWVVGRDLWGSAHDCRS